MGVMKEPPAIGPEEREPPCSDEAEQSVLGCLLNDNTRMPLVADLIDQRSFYHHHHRAIFGAIDDLLKSGHPVDVVTVYDYLKEAGADLQACSLKYLNALAHSVPSGHNARRYAEIVAERYAERELIAACDEAVAISWDKAGSLADRLERAAAVIARAGRLRQGVGLRVPVLKLDALRSANEQITWEVKHVIPSNSVGMLFGGSGTFKSFIALDAGLHVAHGLPWMGRITAQGPVLYIAAEGGAGLWPRINAWHRSRGVSWNELPFYVVPQAIDLGVDAWRVVDAAQAVGVHPRMVIVDTLSQTYSGEENSANEMAAYLREISMRFRALWGCAVLLVHHTGHQATERPRGSSAIRANVDFLFSVYRDEKEMLATVSCVKQKDGDVFRDAVFSLSVCELGRDADGDSLTSLVARHLSSADEVERAKLAEQAAGRGGRGTSFMALVSNGMDERDLRKQFYALLEGLELEAKKKAYSRARKQAIDNGQIEIAQGLVIDLRKGAK